MVRTAFAQDTLYPYFNTVSKQNPCSVGLIIGQTVGGRDYIVHFARTPSFQGGSNKDQPPKVVKSVEDVNEDWVAEHAQQATKMLPGGIHVLGIFVVASQDMLNPFSPKLKSILSKLCKSLASFKYLFGNSEQCEKLVLSYSSATQQYTSKSYDVRTGAVKPVDFKFVSEDIKFKQFECKYELDNAYDFTETKSPLKKHMSLLLDKISEGLQGAVFLFNGELKAGDDGEAIETIGKKKKTAKSIGTIQDDLLKPVQVSIMKKCDENLEDVEVMDCSNQIRLFGHVACRLWLHPKSTIKDASEAIKQDILRSLSTRFDMHWDSLTEEEHGEDINSVHETPRRVLVYLPHSKVAISDYLFPGEGPQDAQSSLEEVLDIKIKNVDEVSDVEGQADLTEYCSEALESSSAESVNHLRKDNTFFLYIVALAVLLVALMVPLVIYYR